MLGTVNGELGITYNLNHELLITDACHNPMTSIIETMNATNFETNKKGSHQ